MSSRATFVRYGFSGLATLGVYLWAGHLLRGLGMSLAWLAPLAFTLAVTVNYALQKFWVFGDRRRIAASLPRYLAMVAWGYGINSLALVSLASHLPLLWAQVLSAGLVVASNALLAFCWVFAAQRGQ